MQQDQVKGMLDRGLAVIVTMLLGWMVKRGWLGESDAATLVPAIVLLPSLAWGWWNNRDQALLSSAGNVVDPNTGKKTLIVTSPEMAAATPGQNNIVSNADHKVVPK